MNTNEQTVTIEEKTAMQLTPLQQKWLDALRSGKYIQGTMRLRSQSSVGDKFCCLGVACDVIDPTIWRKEGTRITWGAKQITRLPDDTAHELNLTLDNQETLIRMNDEDRCTFSQIADRLEAHFRATNKLV